MTSDLELTFTASARLYQDALGFLTFLRKAARKHSVTISFSVDQDGEFKLSVPGKECWDLDLFLQEIIFQHGLYYYLCTVSNRREVARSVVKPIFEDLLVSRFSVAYPVQLQKHLIEGSSGWFGGEFLDGNAQAYEVLFQKLKLKMISGYEFIRNLDDLLTEFMLTHLEHPKGEQSPKFNVLVDRCHNQNILRVAAAPKLFKRVHALRTRGLHRLEREIPDAEINELAQNVYYVFEWQDDYRRAQAEKTVRLTGKRYRRVRYGDEIRTWPKRSCAEDTARWKSLRGEWPEIISRPCHDCGVLQGELHLWGCDMEVCPRCGGQYICCTTCRTEEDDLDES
ncbi:MAG: hypothetical protein CXZ00_08085 [Acidobacteria bacterium]|nr:MAG: hypothetical protein CXZ00_08085 [Acidobacteriota bacterium]